MRLDKDERDVIIKALSSVIKEYVGQELTPILDKIAALETGKADAAQLASIRAAISNLQRGRGGNDAIQ
jgi:hypothetical protein